MIAFKKELLVETKEAIPEAGISIEWPIGRVSLMQVIWWGLKLSAFYTRCEQDYNLLPSARALGGCPLTGLCESWHVDIPVCCVLFLVNLQVWTCSFKRTHLLLSKKCSFASFFVFAKKGMWHTFFVQARYLRICFCNAFSFLNLFTNEW